MTRREVVIEALHFRRPPYVPWEWYPTHGCAERLAPRLGGADFNAFLGNHFVGTGAAIDGAEMLSPTRYRDPYGVVWDKTIDRDIGTPCDWPLKRPEDLARFEWPDVDSPHRYAHIPQLLADNAHLYRQFGIGFSLYERAWTMRGMEALLTDMVERPEFVEELLDAICEHNVRQLARAVKFDFDGCCFGDDYGMQTGLIMGPAHWRHFIKPRLARMFAVSRDAGKTVYLHSCGRVDSLLDDLVEIGLNCFNPFQPEVMDVFEMIPRYRGRLAFHGGMSVQKVLPFGTVGQVRAQTRKLIAAGAGGGLVFSPSHSVPRDVPPENLLAMQEELTAQPGFVSLSQHLGA